LVSHIKGRIQIEKVSENRMLRKVFRLKRDEETEGLKKAHNENFIICTVHQIGPIIKMIKSRSMRWSGRVVRKG
jgi:hypothetical protein